MFPPPTYNGEIDKWEEWSWQLKRYAGLYKPLAYVLMDEAETTPEKIIDELQEYGQHVTSPI